MKGKRGSHVGVILSFVIFIGFLIFIYPLLIAPAIKISNNKEFILEKTSTSLTSLMSAEMKTISITVANSSQDCVKLSNFLSSSEIDSRIIVKNGQGGSEVAYVPNGDLDIVRGNTEDNFFKIYNSEEFDELGTSHQGSCGSKSYEIGLAKKDNYIFETEVSNVVAQYNGNYANLKNNLNISQNSEFDFEFTYENRTSVGTEKETGGKSVYAKESQVQYVNKDGKILIGKIRVRVW